MEELMKSIESAIVAAEKCVSEAHYDCTDQTDGNEQLYYAELMLQEALCNFAQLCNMVEVQ
ncbi:hypothetical protein GH808_09055 [Acetobacterium fimetarium]|uniref:Uncharacterized protein n=1 Tax=Acetobacterium fimetarium TaxID=52691 RepID=A0ABR6WVC6_9FIRM|nr:hypothetical protein [Acetobacterium fimetarium]MBC3804577.1 hypothetical protein [Acetobacterium fimetarium]